ncbi:type II toxin-antitoxin system VapC family toxin [Microlunatus elymi]|uniref:Type II toxin-antitoxin system VapC family toxin n=1 Tax=Microlunatus elymi TaxID=2596828 RepID=A0A516PZK6_9ACTN|nr:type II toxin-antitoxin system VapC family toxin [Microlunatus elymi]QDP96577.1 type II toxin-antitoxin system VapC family toxin [Microlunatus elymi]
MTVVDASIVVRLLLNRRRDQDLRDRFAKLTALEAPGLIDAEVASAIRGLLLTSSGQSISAERADEMIADYADLPLQRYPMQPLQRRVLELRNHFTAYDGFYVALAELVKAPLFTGDKKYRGAPITTIAIETWTD